MRFLSDEWIASIPGASPDGGAEEDFSGSVLAVVTGGPDGDVRFVTTFDAGRPISARSGDAKGPSVSLSIDHADATAVLEGRADLNALFISGRMKVAGEATGPLLELLRWSQCDYARRTMAVLAERTD